MLDVELVLEAGDERFCEAVEDPVTGLPLGEVLTDKGDVKPELFEVIVAFGVLLV